MPILSHYLKVLRARNLYATVYLEAGRNVESELAAVEADIVKLETEVARESTEVESSAVDADKIRDLLRKESRGEPASGQAAREEEKATTSPAPAASAIDALRTKWGAR